jgi:hypothetical protein
MLHVLSIRRQLLHDKHLLAPPIHIIIPPRPSPEPSKRQTLHSLRHSRQRLWYRRKGFIHRIISKSILRHIRPLPLEVRRANGTAIRRAPREWERALGRAAKHLAGRLFIGLRVGVGDGAEDTREHAAHQGLAAGETAAYHTNAGFDRHDYKCGGTVPWGC